MILTVEEAERRERVRMYQDILRIRGVDVAPRSRLTVDQLETMVAITFTPEEE